MAIKTVITDYEAYNDRADEIDLRKEGKLAQQTIVDLKQTMKKYDYVCLAAPHIGVNKRILCINFKGDIRTFCNPLMTASEGFELSREKCPALNNKEYIRPRQNKVTIMYQNPMGKVVSQTFSGLAARVMQYGIDILDGLLLSDVGLELDENWDKGTEAERDEILGLYLESLDIKRKDIKTQIDNDPEAKQMMSAIEFMESVQKGETEVEAFEVKNESEK